MALQPNTIPSETSRTLRARLAAGIVSFTFTKIDGTTRPASGTTFIDLIPEAFRPIGAGRRTPADLVTYFDLDRMAWRSCKADRIVSIDD
jgi:hypothetical protein